jgi:hypothetical protein
MNIITLELEYTPILHLLPYVRTYFGTSVYITLTWLNFSLTLKHISGVWDNKGLTLSTPSMTLNSYTESAYRMTFEICCFGYVYRKGLFKRKGEEPLPVDNTNGFVPSSWFNQFKKPIGGKDLDAFFDAMEEFFKDKDKQD